VTEILLPYADPMSRGRSWRGAAEAHYCMLETGVRIAANQERFLTHVDLFFGAFRQDPVDCAETFQVWVDPDPRAPSGWHRLYREGELLYRTRDYRDLFLFLEWQLCGLAVRSRRYLLLHAGMAARQGRGVVIAGPSGAGKTTLVAALALQGWDYLTDEILVVDPEGPSVVPFPRSLLVREGALAGWPHLLRCLRERSLGGGAPYLGDRRFLAPPPAGGVEAVGLVLLVAYRPGEAVTVRPLSRCRGLFELTRHCFNLGSLGEAGLDALCTLTSGSRFAVLTGGDVREAVARVERLARGGD